ncbi:MAG: hypothetical protein ACREE5_04095 [Acetobacteraceae bacterium]
MASRTEDIEIHALVGLQHAFQEEFQIAVIGSGRGDGRGMGMSARFRHAGRAYRADALEHQDAVGAHVQFGIVSIWPTHRIRTSETLHQAV